MLAFRLFARLTAYYVAVTIVVFVALRLFPGLREYMPFGGVEALMSHSRPGIEGMLAPKADIGNLRESVYWLVITILGALLTALPVSWVYIAVRNRKDYDQSLVDTIVILPIVVTSIVIIVQAVFSWLVVFNVVNTSSDFVRAIWTALDRITAPLYRPVRRIMPDFGGIDFSPIVVLLLIWVISRLLGGVELDLQRSYYMGA